MQLFGEKYAGKLFPVSAYSSCDMLSKNSRTFLNTVQEMGQRKHCGTHLWNWVTVMQVGSSCRLGHGICYERTLGFRICGTNVIDTVKYPDFVFKIQIT